MMLKMWKNNTNFLHSGPYIDLPAYHPTRLFNILVGGLYMVVVPFVYFRIFRYKYMGAETVKIEVDNDGVEGIIQHLRARRLQDQRVGRALSKAVLQRRKKRNMVRFLDILGNL